MPKIDYLEEDFILPPNQLYALMSFVWPEGNQKADKILGKCRGVFGNEQEAKAHSDRLMKLDNTFDIFLLPMGKWVTMPPNLTEIEDQQYGEPFMQGLMEGYRDSQAAAKQHFEERKRAVKEKGLDATLTEEEKQLRDAHLTGAESVHPTEIRAAASSSKSGP